MTLCRLIAPPWLKQQNTGIKPVLEGEFTNDQIATYNAAGYNIYYLPNHPKHYQPGVIVDGSHIDNWKYVFVDFDLKSKTFDSKNAFIGAVVSSGITPTRIVDSGNGIHVYWRVSDLSGSSYLRLQYRLMRLFNTDDSIGTLYQLMRLPGTLNTKNLDNLVMCEILAETDEVYTSEELDNVLPTITPEDEQRCQVHYDKTFGLNQEQYEINDQLPAKFGDLIKENSEVKNLFAGNVDDRSKADYRLGHIMFAYGFSKEEAASVLVNGSKASERSQAHRHSYAKGIVDKIWIHETGTIEQKVDTSPTVRSILDRGEDTLKGTRFPCNKLIDDTVHGFRLGQVIGIIGGSGVGKTTLTLNAFIWFAEQNPDYHHFFFSLEQPAGEIASRIRTICGTKEALYDKIHIVSNYAESGDFRNFSIDDIEQHLVNWEKETGKKVGACVIDHIGVLSKETKNGENEGLIGICRRMKSVAVKVNMMLIMLSQAPREKAGIGDLELNKDAAFGTVFFESFVDYLVCLWQPLKRMYAEGAPTIMAFKFAKIRHKKQGEDRIQEDVRYQLRFDPKNETLREVTQDEEISAKFFLNKATNARKLDRKTDILPYESRHVHQEVSNEPKTNHH
jgi:hypothetical protein